MGRKEVFKRKMTKMRSYLMEYLSTHPCVDCGEDDPVVLEFDHIVRANKFKSIPMICSGGSWAQLQREMAKCAIRCANCHRRKTARELGWVGRLSVSKSK